MPRSPKHGFPFRTDHLPKLEPKEDLTANPEIAKWGERRFAAERWLVGRTCAVLILGCVFVAIVYVSKLSLSSSGVKQEASESHRAVRLNQIDEAKRVLGAFLQCKTNGERAQYVRHADETIPRMKRYYAMNTPPSEATWDFPGNGFEISVGGIAFLELPVAIGDSIRPAIFERTARGLLLDWESFVFYSNVPWRQFLNEERLTPTAFRVILSADSYYNFQYADALRYASFRLEDPERTASCWAFVEQDSPPHKELQRVLQLGQLPERKHLAGDSSSESSAPGEETVATLRISFRRGMDGKSHGLAWIESVVADGWLIP